MTFFNISNLYVIILFALGHASSQNHSIPEEDGKIVFVCMIYRHGERTPHTFYASDPYKNLSYWPEGYGMLTKTGKQQHLELGKWLRQRYLELIPGGKYAHSLAYVRSTDVDRTLMSAQANLAGFFYPTKEEMWSNINWQPIPVHTIPSPLDRVLSMRYPCQKVNEEIKAVLKSNEVQEYNKKNEEMYQYLTKHMGQVVDDPLKVESVRLTFYLEQLRNYTLPDWTKQVFPDKIEELSKMAYRIYTGTKTLRRLKGGPLLNEIIGHFKDKRDNKQKRTFWIYSGHDQTVAHLLAAMNIFDPHIPVFAATLMLELRKNSNNEFFVSVHYKNSTEGPPTVLTIPGCTPSCPLDSFEALLKEFLPLATVDECKVDGKEDLKKITKIL